MCSEPPRTLRPSNEVQQHALVRRARPFASEQMTQRAAGKSRLAKPSNSSRPEFAPNTPWRRIAVLRTYYDRSQDAFRQATGRMTTGLRWSFGMVRAAHLNRRTADSIYGSRMRVIPVGHRRVETRGYSERMFRGECAIFRLLCCLATCVAVEGCSVDNRRVELSEQTLLPDAGVADENGVRVNAGQAPCVSGAAECSPALDEGSPTVAGLESTEAMGAGTSASCDGDGSCTSTDGAASAGACVPTGPRDCASELDNDCDGQPDNVVDDVCVCAPGNVEPCDEHPDLDGRGQCRPGARTCILGAGNGTSNWGACEGSVGPGDQDSCTVVGDDSNCDGTNNGGCPCVEGEQRLCGPEVEIGICKRGNQTCVNGSFGQCIGAVFAARRDCSSQQDNDCDGRPDNTVDNVCTCAIASEQACGTHPGRDGNGQCRPGSQTCVAGANNATSSFGACSGSVGPQLQDSCADGNDANCNGLPNEGCACVNGQTRPCGPDTDVGVCQRGTQTCANGAFGQCQGAIFPALRNCASQQDNDCDGRPDNTIDNVCTCSIGSVQACGTHPGRDGNGPCKAGSQSCQAGASNATSAFGGCIGSVGPGARDCSSPQDNDCDGRPDNTFDNVCLAPTNPFTCNNVNPPPTVEPFFLFTAAEQSGTFPSGRPPAATGGTVQNGIYAPTRVDVYGQASAPSFTVNELTFEFRDGFVQVGYGAYFFGGIEKDGNLDQHFVGTATSVGSSLQFSVTECDTVVQCMVQLGAICAVPSSVSYSATANNLVTIQPASDGSTVVTTYTRQ